MKKALEFIRKYKTYIFLPLICLMQFFACFHYDLWIVSTILAAILFLMSSFGDILCYVLFFESFNGVGELFVASLIVAFVLILFRYFISVFRKKEKFYTLPFVLTTIICVLFSIINHHSSQNARVQGFIMISLFYLIYFAFVYRNSINIRKSFDFFVYGIIASAAVAFTTLLFSGCNINIFDTSDSFTRLKLLNFNENLLAISCELILSYYIFAIMNKRNKLIKNLLFISVAIALGLATLSKTFFVILSIVFLYFICFLIYRYKQKSLQYIIPIVLFFTILYVLVRPVFYAIISRFTIYSYASSINSITTGRYSIWRLYIESSLTSIPRFLFGFGFFSDYIGEFSPHNSYIFLLNRMGLIGLTLFGILLYSYFKAQTSKFKPSIRNFLPILTFMLISTVELAFSFRYIFFLIMFVMLLFEKSQENTKN